MSACTAMQYLTTQRIATT